jgi:hypothetical protein
MKSLSRDTSPEAQKKVFDMLRDTPASKKFKLTFELIDTARLLVSAGIRRRHPTASEEELRNLLIAKLLPREDVIKAYGFDPRAEYRQG